MSPNMHRDPLSCALTRTTRKLKVVCTRMMYLSNECSRIRDIYFCGYSWIRDTISELRVEVRIYCNILPMGHFVCA